MPAIRPIAQTNVGSLRGSFGNGQGRNASPLMVANSARSSSSVIGALCLKIRERVFSVRRQLDRCWLHARREQFERAAIQSPAPFQRSQPDLEFADECAAHLYQRRQTDTAPAQSTQLGDHVVPTRQTLLNAILFRKAAHSTAILFKIELISPPTPGVRNPSMIAAASGA